MYTYTFAGNTFPVKDLIKSLGSRWDSLNKQWVYRSNIPCREQFGTPVYAGVNITETDPEGVSVRLVTPTLPDYAATFEPGAQIEIKAWVAKQIAKQENLELCFRNLQLTKIHGETEKAVQATVKFVSKVANSCHLCGRELDTELSRATGIGPVCAKKLKLDRGTYQDAQAALKFLDEYAKQVGEIGPVWIAKSQMI